jgi:hypothetical protein
MMKENHLPVGRRFRQLPIEPADLLAIEIHRVEREKLHTIAADCGDYAGPARERVVPLASHIEEGIFPLCANVVVASHCVEGDAGIEQRLERFLESDPV